MPSTVHDSPLPHFLPPATTPHASPTSWSAEAIEALSAIERRVKQRRTGAGRSIMGPSWG
jgi:hypothetical protein